jgi:uncharacterized protein
MPMSSEPSPPVPPLTPSPAASNDNLWAMLCHATALTIYVGLPLGNIIGPLIVWLIKKDTIPLVDDQGKESLNFQLSILIYAIVSLLLIMVVIGIGLIVAVIVFHLVMTVIATVKASQGIAYRYPLCIRFIR